MQNCWNCFWIFCKWACNQVIKKRSFIETHILCCGYILCHPSAVQYVPKVLNSTFSIPDETALGMLVEDDGSCSLILGKWIVSTAWYPGWMCHTKERLLWKFQDQASCIAKQVGLKSEQKLTSLLIQLPYQLWGFAFSWKNPRRLSDHRVKRRRVFMKGTISWQFQWKKSLSCRSWKDFFWEPMETSTSII